MKPHFTAGKHRFRILSSATPAQMVLEWRAQLAGLSIPLTSRGAWLSAMESKTLYLATEGMGGSAMGVTAVRLVASLALPGFHVLRVHRFGPGVPASARLDTLRALARLPGMIPRVLRIHVELYSTSSTDLEDLEMAASRAGFDRSTTPRSFEVTSLVDLRPTLELVFASFSRSARQNIRGLDKVDASVGVVADERFAPRMTHLLDQTMQRTGGRVEGMDWPRILRFSNQFPSLSRVVGLFRGDRSQVSSLLAFAWGHSHGDTVEYSTAASSRVAEIRIPLAYPLVWDLMSWARDGGALWFDLGGITPGGTASNDPLGGISDFKRAFGGQTVRVSSEWVSGQERIANRLARTVSRLGRWAVQISGMKQGHAADRIPSDAAPLEPKKSVDSAGSVPEST